MSKALVSGGLFAATVLVMAGAAQAQTIRAQPVDPLQQRLAAIEGRLDRLADTAGAQVVVLHQTQDSLPLWPANTDTWPNNNQRAQAICESALGDRYGRVLSRERSYVEDRYYLSRIVCETSSD